MTLRGTNQELSRPYNRRIVLEFIRARGPAQRAEIAEGVGLTVQTVSTIVRELEDQGYLLPVRAAPQGRGAPAQTLHLNPEGGFAIGIDISPLGINAGLMNLAGDILGSATRPLRDTGPEAGFALIGEMVAAMRDLRPGGRILGVGLALPGPFDVEAMSFVGPTTMSGWGGVPLRARLTAVTGLPGFIEVDTAAAALGVRLHGKARHLRDFYYLHMGAGLGGTMVHDGRALRGAHGNAGEVGHLPLVPEGRPCACGNRGCLERYVSMEGYGQRAPGQGPQDWAAEVAPILNRAVTVIENLFDPETIVLGGIAPEPILAALVAAADRLPPSVSARSDRALPRIIVSTDRQSVLRGAAALALAGVLSPQRATVNGAPDTAVAGDPFWNGLAA